MGTTTSWGEEGAGTGHAHFIAGLSSPGLGLLITSPRHSDVGLDFIIDNRGLDLNKTDNREMGFCRITPEYFKDCSILKNADIGDRSNLMGS